LGDSLFDRMGWIGAEVAEVTNQFWEGVLIGWFERLTIGCGLFSAWFWWVWCGLGDSSEFIWKNLDVSSPFANTPALGV
jgi:hypothetical protein